MTADQAELLTGAMPLIHERINKLTEAAPMLGFLFVDEVDYDETDVARCSTTTGSQVVAAARDALGALADWTTEAIDEALRAALVDGLGLKPRNAFGPVRVAVTGRQGLAAAVRVPRAAGSRGVAGQAGRRAGRRQG